MILVVCIQEHRYHHSKVELKYHDTVNGWTFISASAWKISVNAVIGGVRIPLNPHALKSLNSIKKIQPRMLVATFNGDLDTTIIFCYSPINANDETEITTFNSELSPLVHFISNYNVLIIGGDMKAQIGKDENNKILLTQVVKHKWGTSNWIFTWK